MAAASTPPVAQQIVAVMRVQTARARPAIAAPAVERVPARRPITGTRTTLPVLGHATRSGARWLHVQLPGRPNGHQGWIRQRAARVTSTSWRIVVDLSRRTVDVRRGGHTQRRFTAIVGAGATPTPTGHFFVEETVELASSDAGAPYALALSARSDVPQEFEGGPGQIALHGLDNIGGTLGTAASHGCIRLSDRAIAWLAMRVGPGVAVIVER